MKCLKILDKPEGDNLFWAVILIALCCLFACDRHTSQTIADYWFVWLVPTGLFYWLQRRAQGIWVKAGFGFLALLCFCLFAVPYLMMLGLWIILKLSNLSL